MKFILSILVIIASVILFFVVANPLYGDISKLRLEVATYNVALDNSTELQKKRDELIDKYKNIGKADRERLEHFLPNTVNNIQFILEMERIANSHSMPMTNIKFESLKPVETKTTANGNTTVITSIDPNSSLPYGSFPIEFTTEGDYDTFVLFLKDVERNLRLVDVKSISFSVPQGTKNALNNVDVNKYTYNVKVETYWLK